MKKQHLAAEWKEQLAEVRKLDAAIEANVAVGAEVRTRVSSTVPSQTRDTNLGGHGGPVPGLQAGQPEDEARHPTGRKDYDLLEQEKPSLNEALWPTSSPHRGKVDQVTRKEIEGGWLSAEFHLRNGITEV